jgi:hypothetical protein
VKKLYLLLSLLLLLASAPALAQVDAQAAAQVPLRFFQSINGKDYATAWSLLTEASKTRLSTLVAEEAKVPVEEVRQLFDSNDPAITGSFWADFRSSARPDIYLTRSYNYAADRDGFNVISLTKPGEEGGDNSLELLVKNENGYKFALVESYDI